MKKYIERNSVQVVNELQLKYNLYQRIPDLEELIASFCSLHKIEDVFSESRKSDIVNWRYAFMMVLLLNNYTQKLVGFYLNRDHSTVIYAIKAFNNELNGFGNDIGERVRKFIIFAAKYMIEKENNLKGRSERTLIFIIEKIREEFKEDSPELKILEEDALLYSNDKSLTLKKILQEALEYYEHLKIEENAI